MRALSRIVSGGLIGLVLAGLVAGTTGCDETELLAAAAGLDSSGYYGGDYYSGGGYSGGGDYTGSGVLETYLSDFVVYN